MQFPTYRFLTAPYSENRLAHVTQIQTDLVQLVRNGSEKAIELLYRKYADGMYNVCIRLCGDHELAKDVFQEAFIRAMYNLKQLRENNQFGGWLKRIVINECIRQMKYSKMVADFTESSCEIPVEEGGWFEDIDISVVNEEIKKLPEGCRQVFVLYAVEDFSHKEIANTLLISESTSKSQYQRARALLRERLLKRN